MRSRAFAAAVTRRLPVFAIVGIGADKHPAALVVGDDLVEIGVLGAAERAWRVEPVAGEGMSSVLPLTVAGSERAFRLRTTPMRDNESQLLGAVTLLEDITHLREIDQLKSEFIATASHELRTPLTSVQMGVHLLLEGAAGELNDKQAEVLGACREDWPRRFSPDAGAVPLSLRDRAWWHPFPIEQRPGIRAPVAANLTDEQRLKIG